MIKRVRHKTITKLWHNSLGFQDNYNKGKQQVCITNHLTE